MINELVQSALKTGWLSVESEGLIRQVATIRRFRTCDMSAMQILDDALQQGVVKREGRDRTDLLLLTRQHSS